MQPYEREMAQQELQICARMLSTEKVESYLDFSKRITLPDGRGKGQAYDPRSHQVQRAFLLAADRGVRKLTIVKPVQDGGTLVSLILLFYRAIVKHQTVVLAYPTMDLAKDIWTQKILPVLRAFGGQEPVRGGGGGAEGGASRIVTLPGGGQFILRTSGGKGESGQAAITADAGQIDEFDDWPSLDRTRALAQRFEESPDPLLIQSSTVKNTANSILVEEYNRGSRGRLHYACPSCGKYQELNWGAVKWTEDNGRLVEGSERIICQKNGCALPATRRREMLNKWILVQAGQSINDAGELVGKPLVLNHFSIMWNRLESPRKSLSSSVEAFIEARTVLEETGNHGPMKRFYHDYLAIPYDGEAQELEASPVLRPNHLATKSKLSTFSRMDSTSDIVKNGDKSLGLFSRHMVFEMPTKAVGTFAGVDVQHNRVYWVCIAAEENGTEYDCGWGVEYARVDQAPGNDEEMFLLFDRTADLIAGYSRDLPFQLGGIDCADGEKRNIILKWASTRPHNWRPVRGDVMFKPSGPMDIDGISTVRDGIIHLQVNNLRDQLQAALRRPDDVPGAIIYPSGLNANSTMYFRHMCKRQTVIADMKTKRTEQLLSPGREDWLDGRLIARGLRIGWQMVREQQAKLKVLADAGVRQAQITRVTTELQREEGDLPQRLPPMARPYRPPMEQRQRRGWGRLRRW